MSAERPKAQVAAQKVSPTLRETSESSPEKVSPGSVVMSILAIVAMVAFVKTFAP